VSNLGIIYLYVIISLLMTTIFLGVIQCEDTQYQKSNKIEWGYSDTSAVIHNILTMISHN